MITLPPSFRTSLSGVVSEGVAEVETADGSDENAKCGDQQNLHDVFSFTSAFAAVRTLPTPDPSGYVDRESSVVVAFPTGARGFPRWGSGGGVVRNYGTMYAMRPLRNFKTNQCCHLISRIANRAFYLTDEERTRFVERLWRVAKFSGIEVLAYCFMSNHFHLLVNLPEAPELSDGELFDRIAALERRGLAGRVLMPDDGEEYSL